MFGNGESSLGTGDSERRANTADQETSAPNGQRPAWDRRPPAYIPKRLCEDIVDRYWEIFLFY